MDSLDTSDEFMPLMLQYTFFMLLAKGPQTTVSGTERPWPASPTEPVASLDNV